VEALFAGPSASCLAADEILTRVTIPLPKGKGVYLKLMRRAALDLAVAGVAVFILLDADNVCSDVKIALGAVAPNPIRASDAEVILRGRLFTEDLAAQAGRVAGTECQPINDIRASQNYRCSMVEVLAKRALLQAASHLDQGGNR
jgi:carbon-monoxide dehydrogenase medium subunit